MVDQILMKFYVWKDIVSQSCCIKSRTDLVTSEGEGELGGGNLTRTNPLSLGKFGGGVNFEKLEKIRYF